MVQQTTEIRGSQIFAFPGNTKLQQPTGMGFMQNPAGSGFLHVSLNQANNNVQNGMKWNIQLQNGRFHGWKSPITIYENIFTLFDLHLAESKKRNTLWSTSQCTYSLHVLRQYQMTPNSGGCSCDQSRVSRIRHTGLEGYPLAQRLPCSCSLLHASISPLSFKGSR